ncbi:MAG: IS200/IS605 family transposase [Thermoanaerobaculia bacterium]|nr:IS200/IS605 family transposase [Thermoanaerobaculia bacterium]
MPQSLSQIFVHIVFSTKNRLPYLEDRTILDETHVFLASTCERQRCASIAVGGVTDHAHILCTLHRTVAIADLVKELKRETSIWLKKRSRDLRSFYWQEGYGAFSVSTSQIETVRTYIRNQERHHATRSFQDEFRHLLDRHDIEYDERYVWD